MYWLVNVSVNPAGRFGAPETEPGPSGVDCEAEDELSRISFVEVVVRARAEPVVPRWAANIVRTALPRTRRRVCVSVYNIGGVVPSSHRP
jgi:hypothetical protein